MSILDADNLQVEAVAHYFRGSRDALEHAISDKSMLAAVATIADIITTAYRRGGKLLIAGNGGSAADAQHIAAEFISRFRFNRAPLPAIALTTDTSALTAIGNDYGFDHVFERQILGLGRPGDAFLAISTSGRSPNVLAALRAAREIGMTTVGMTGARDVAMSPLCDVVVVAPAHDTAFIQQIHITAAHAICGLVEQTMFGS
jgi:D-sedoheptulose 7-phosphate isomerase